MVCWREAISRRDVTDAACKTNLQAQPVRSRARGGGAWRDSGMSATGPREGACDSVIVEHAAAFFFLLLTLCGCSQNGAFFNRGALEKFEGLVP